MEVSEDISVKQKEYLRLPSAYWNATILKVQDNKAQELAYKYVKMFPEVRKQGLILSIFGHHSTGRSSLAAVLLKSAIASGYTGLFISADNLQEFVQSKDKIGEDTYQERALNCDFLVIDDFNPERRWYVTKILRERLEWMRPTIIVSIEGIKSLFTDGVVELEMSIKISCEETENLIKLLL